MGLEAGISQQASITLQRAIQGCSRSGVKASNSRIYSQSPPKFLPRAYPTASDLGSSENRELWRCLGNPELPDFSPWTTDAVVTQEPDAAHTCNHRTQEMFHEMETS